MLSDRDGAEAVRRARRSVAASVGAPVGGVRLPPTGPEWEERRGVFVTLRRHPSGALRGCIGYPLPTYPLGLALDRAAAASATDDPRFPPVRAEELESLTVEVSVLTPPTPVPADRPQEAIQVGRDGLIVEGERASGLLLPQVATEMGWSVEELLDGVCEKAALPPGAWRAPGVRLYRFEAEVFQERTPGGAVERVPTAVSRPTARRGPRV